VPPARRSASSTRIQPTAAIQTTYAGGLYSQPSSLIRWPFIAKNTKTAKRITNSSTSYQGTRSLGAPEVAGMMRKAPPVSSAHSA
jgi:hypothetical protein